MANLISTQAGGVSRRPMLLGIASSVAATSTIQTRAQAQTSPVPVHPDLGTSDAPIVISPLTWNPTYPPLTPFKATNGLYNLQYQFLVMNVFNRPATVVGGDVLDAHTRQATGHNQSISDDGHDIRLKLRPFASTGEGHGVSTIPGGQAGLMFFYLSYPSVDAIPARLRHRFTVEGDDTSPVTATDAGLTRVSNEQSIVIGPTMRGSGWLNGNGAGPSVYEHPMILQPTNGTAKPVQAYAIDWLKLDERGHTFDGDPFKNESFFGYGQPILSATDGVVVHAEDGFPNQIPNKPEPVKQAKAAYGNNIIVAIGGGKYAIYCHLKPGSVAVRSASMCAPDVSLPSWAIRETPRRRTCTSKSRMRRRFSTRTRCRSSSTRCTIVSASCRPFSRLSTKCF